MNLFHCCTPMIRMRNTGKAMPKWRVRRETAMFLIDPADYVQAERNMMARSIRCPVRWMSRYSFWRTTVGFWNTANRYTTEERRT